MVDRRSGDSPAGGCGCDESVVGGGVGDDAGPDEVSSALFSSESDGLDAALAGISEAGPAGATSAPGDTVELVGVAEDTGAAASEADNTGPAIAAERTATGLLRCVTTLR